MTHPSQVGSTSTGTILAAMLLDTHCRTLGRRIALRSWSQLACALAWTVFATCSLRTSSRLSPRSTQRATKTCSARTAIRGRRRSAVLTLPSNRTGLHLTQLVPLVLCLVRCSVKLWRGPLSRPICPQMTTLCGRGGEEVTRVSLRQGEPNGRHDATRSHDQDSREDHRDQIKRMIWHFTRRLRLCLAADGGYFADLR